MHPITVGSGVLREPCEWSIQARVSRVAGKLLTAGALLSKSCRSAGALRITCVDLDAGKQSDAWTQLSTDLLPALPADEEEVAIRDAEMSAAKLARSAVKYTGAVRLNMPARGSLTGLRVVPQADTSVRMAAAPGMAQLRIRAVGLNFRDVLNVRASEL